MAAEEPVEPPPGRVLVIAGSDSGGGAGIQADIKTITALGGYAATALTAITAQNTLGVHAVSGVEIELVRQQIRVVLSDIGADAIKTGMLHSAEVVVAVVQEIEAAGPSLPIIVDPVITAKDSSRLSDDRAVEAILSELVPRAAVLTPNVPEAIALTGLDIETRADQRAAAEALLAKGAKAVVLKGGHMASDVVADLLVTQHGDVYWLEGPRIHTRHTHGTGCTLASAIAAGVAEGLRLIDAVERARDYVRRAIELAPGFGQGFGPLHHGHRRR